MECSANGATAPYRVSLGGACGSQCAPESVAHGMVVRFGGASGSFYSTCVWRHAGTSPEPAGGGRPSERNVRSFAVNRYIDPNLATEPVGGAGVLICS